VACSRRSFCIINGLEGVRKAYVASRGVDQFKIKVHSAAAWCRICLLLRCALLVMRLHLP
jgi:hypothetical protein